MEKSVVDLATPEQVAAALKAVNKDTNRRSTHGMQVLWELYGAPGYRMATRDLEAKYGGINTNFGWLCKRVAEELGSQEPDEFALADRSEDEHGYQVLTLKPNVVAAMPKKGK